MDTHMHRKLDLSGYIHCAPPLEVKFAVDEASKGVIAGYASTFGGQPDSYGDIVSAGAFATSLAEHKAANTMPLMLWAHNSEEPIGRWTEAKEDAHGLMMRGRLNLETTRGRDAYEHLKAGDVSGLSIGYTVRPNGSKMAANGTRILSGLDLLECSVVAFAANRLARVTGVKSFSSRQELEEILREHLPGRAVKKLMLGGWPALSGEAELPPDPNLTLLAKRLEAATRELKRTSK